MGKHTDIEWAHHTFNYWSGCTKVSPGCTHCYAESMCNRFHTLGGWGAGAERKLASEDYRKRPYAWDRAAAKAGERRRVFAGSLNDWLDPEVPSDWLQGLLGIIAETPNLDWLLLTKRPQLWEERMGDAMGFNDPDGERPIPAGSILACDWISGQAPPNVWVGTSAEDQERFNLRAPQLYKIPAALHFFSLEPLLGPIDGSKILSGCFHSERNGRYLGDHSECAPIKTWVIVGGESGHGARPMHPEWARELRDLCKEGGIPFLFKQWGAWKPLSEEASREEEGWGTRLDLRVLWPDGIGGSGVLGDPEAAREGGCVPIKRVGKKASGRELDGVEHLEFPEVRK